MGKEKYLAGLLGERSNLLEHSIFQQIVDSIPHIIEVWGPVFQDNKIIDFECTYQNQEGNGTQGNLLVKIPSDNGPDLCNKYSQVLLTNTPTQFDLHSEKEQKWFNVSVSKIDDNSILVLKEDITQRKQAIESEQELLQFIIDTAPIGITVYEALRDDNKAITDFRYVMVNQFVKELYAKDNLLDNSLLSVFPEAKKNELFDRLVRVVEKKELVEFVNPIGEARALRWIQNTYTSFKNTVVAIYHDVTDQKKVENDLIISNRELESLNAELKSFNTVTGNDFKDVLKRIYLSLEFIVTKDAHNLSNEGRANIRRTQSAIQKMKLLTEDISNYSQIHQIEADIHIVDTNIIISNVLRDMREALSKADASVELAQFAPMPADSFLLATLIRHLLDNAIKFRKLVTSLQIKLKYSQADEMNFDPNALRDTPYAIISVSDNGIGFKEEFTEKIFEMFFKIHDKTQYRGSGMGLAICRRIMQVHRGFITADGMPGVGSIFNCYFPLLGH